MRMAMGMAMTMAMTIAIWNVHGLVNGGSSGWTGLGAVIFESPLYDDGISEKKGWKFSVARITLTLLVHK